MQPPKSPGFAIPKAKYPDTEPKVNIVKTVPSHPEYRTPSHAGYGTERMRATGAPSRDSDRSERMRATSAEGADIRGERRALRAARGCQHAVARERESMHRPPSEARGSGTVPLDIRAVDGADHCAAASGVDLHLGAVAAEVGEDALADRVAAFGGGFAEVERTVGDF